MYKRRTVEESGASSSARFSSRSPATGSQSKCASTVPSVACASAPVGSSSSERSAASRAFVTSGSRGAAPSQGMDRQASAITE